MTRQIDSANIVAAQNTPEQGAIYRWLITFFPINQDGTAATPVCFWNGIGDYNLQVTDPKTGLTVTRNYSGDGALLGVDGLVYSQGLLVKNARVSLSPIHPGVRNLYSGKIIRNKRVEIHFLQINPKTGNPVGPAFVAFVGTVDKAPLTIQGVMQESSIDFDIASRVRALTKTSASKKSDEWMKANRSGDRFRRYADVANIRIWWGQKKDRAARSSGESIAQNTGTPLAQIKPVTGKTY